MPERWTRAVLRWRGLVLMGWLALAILGALGATNLASHLTTSLAVPGSDSARADALLSAHFADNVEGAFTVVVPLDTNPTTSVHHTEAQITLAARAVSTARVSQQAVLGGLLVTTITTDRDLQLAAPDTVVLRRALVQRHVLGALVTGPPALQHDVTPVLSADLRRGEIIAIASALVLPVVLLGLSLDVLIPLLVAAATSAVALGIIDLLARHMTMVLYVPNVVELIALGLAIDYSVLIVQRFREEEQRSASLSDAVVVTMSSAGRTVAFSALAVAIGLATLTLIPVPFVRSLGAASLVVPIVAIGATATLQPALVASLARWRSARTSRVSRITSRAWARVAHGVTAHPAGVLVASLALVGSLSSLCGWLVLTPGSFSGVPSTLASVRAVALVRQHSGVGALTPIEIVIDARASGGANGAGVSRAIARLARILLNPANDEVVAYGPSWPYVDGSGNVARIFVVATSAFGDPQSRALVAEIRHVDIAAARFPAGTRVDVGGASAQGADFLHALDANVGWMAALALAVAFVVLRRALRSWVLALVAVALDVLSVAVALGCIVAVFRFGVLAGLLGTYRAPAIDGWVPIFVAAVVFGLSMDYEMFVVARIKESHDAGANTLDAVSDGLTRSGPIITVAALIMVGAFVGLVLGHVAGLQEVGVGLAAGVLVDATIVRGLILPAVITLLGPRCWVAPRQLRRGATGEQDLVAR